MNLFPASIRTIGICAPASRISARNFRNGCAFLEQQGIRLQLAAHTMSPENAPDYLSSTAEARLSDLNELIHGECDLILCARGGFGSVHLLEGIDWETLRGKNLPVVGYSDITALHLAMIQKKAGRPVTASMFTSLPGLTPFTERNFRRTMRLLEDRKRSLKKLETLHLLGGRDSLIRAPVFCGNLTMLASLCGTPFMPSFRGMILILEDIDEPVRKVDRCLEQLRLCGIFEEAAAVIFGDFTGCGTRNELTKLFRRFQEELSLPVFSGLRFGHCKNTYSFLCGEILTLEKGVLFAEN